MTQAPSAPSARSLGFAFFLSIAHLAGCGNDAHPLFGPLPYRPGSATVIGAGDGGEAIPSVDDCGTAACKAARSGCAADDAADVVVNAQGNAIDVICYKPDAKVVTAAANGAPPPP